MLSLTYKERYDSPCSLVLGCFDGIHLGHERLIAQAKERGLPVGLMLLTGKDRTMLFTPEERLQIAERVGVDFCYFVHLDAETASLSAERFLRRLLFCVPAKLLICGEDFRFGALRRGTPSLLRNFAPTICCPLAEADGEKISSSRIKALVRRGEIGAANALLAHPYLLRARVEHGRGVGHTYGFPTANFAYPAGKERIGEGVYAVRVGRYCGIANYGARPTFGEAAPALEVYLDGFSGDLYGEELTVFFYEKLREIRRFPSAEALKAQLEADLRAARGMTGGMV